MKNLMCLLSLFLLLSALTGCGKPTTDKSSSDSVTLTPGLKEDIEETVAKNKRFKVSVEKASFNSDEVIVVTVENTGDTTLNHLGFSFQGAPSAISMSRLNCFDIIEPTGKCRFAGVYSAVEEGSQEIKISYDNFGTITEEVLSFNVVGEILPGTHHFLYANIHTKDDCNRESQYQKDGLLRSIGGNDYCAFRGLNYYELETTAIENNPLEVFNNGIDVDEFYCPAGWKLASMKFEQSIVKEKKNVLGQTRDVTIPAGESREVCTKWGILKCKEKKVFYSRLMEVNCY